MPHRGPARVILDTNIWVSFLIGKELKELLVNEKVKLVLSDQLLNEFLEVVQRDKVKKYFPPERIAELCDLLEVIAERVSVQRIESVCRDPKDDYLLALAKYGQVDYLVTGDADLLSLGKYCLARIITPKEFRKAFVLL